MDHNKVITEIMNGNGNKFTVKEILQAHINDGKEFEKHVRGEFKKGSILMTRNETKITMMGRVLKYGIAPVLMLIIGYLIKVKI